MKFLDFDVEKSTNCTFDYLEMREGIDETGKLIGRLCGTGEAGSLVSTISLWLRFKSDTSITERGFLATYTKTGYTWRSHFITIKDHQFGCSIIYTDIIQCAILFVCLLSN